MKRLKIHKTCTLAGQSVHYQRKIINFRSKKWKRINKNLLQTHPINTVPGRKNLYPSHQWYKNRLAAKQRIRVELGCIKDYQLKKLFRSTQNNGQKDYSILQKIECRLDIVLYRLGFSNSIHCSHQFINHGYIRVNGIRTRSKNIILERGDCIDIEPRYWETVSKKIKTFLREKPFFSPPPMYLETNYKLLTSTLLKEPKLTDLYYNTILDIESTKYFYKRG